ncbi:hypothetical protein BH012_20050 [Salmonella enterica]|nr:hypothetical protein [Salmonella enterica]EAX6603588.1 hypothetical protein [Salmonella enterica]
MNYAGNEVLRNEVAGIANEFYEMREKFQLLLDKRLQSGSEDLVEMLTAQALLDIHNDFAHLCRRMAQLDSQFID